jgi:RNA polymerase sigma factor (sigma-70 family)
VLGNHADAEDVTQQTFLNAYRSLESGTKPRKAENWLLTIAHNEVRQHFRSTRSKPQQVELDDRVADQSYEPTGPTVADVLRALQHLPESQRAAIVMREFEGRSYAEMAKILDVTPSALEALVFRARRSLADYLEGALTCEEAERAVSRRMDGRLSRRDARRLKAHMRDCPACARFEETQHRQRRLIKGLTVLPIPASLFLFRGQSATASVGLGGTAAAGASATAGGGAVGAGLLGGGLVVKAAAVTAAAATVAGGVGVGTGAVHVPGVPLGTSPTHRTDVDQTRKGARAAQVQIARANGERPGPAATANEHAQANATAHATATAGEHSSGEPNGRAVGHDRTGAPTAAAANGSEHATGRSEDGSKPAGKTEKPTKPTKPETTSTGQGQTKPTITSKPTTPSRGKAVGKPAVTSTSTDPTDGANGKPTEPNPNAGSPANSGKGSEKTENLTDEPVDPAAATPERATDPPPPADNGQARDRAPS